MMINTASLFASVEMTRVDPHLFISNPETDFEAITENNPSLKEKMVSYLFENDMLNHEQTKAFDSNASFAAYYKHFGPLYRLIDLNHDQLPELIFSGYPASGEEKESLEIYTTVQGNVIRIYYEVGHLLAYKIQPNTNEILLYHHQYPCCLNASHNLNRLRLVNGKIQTYKRYFLGRDKDMVGPFFPKQVNWNGKYHSIKKEKVLFWSPAMVEQNAWLGRTPENKIATYDSTSVYTVLGEENGFEFVLMHGAPVSSKVNRVINTDNFKEIWIYGWIKKEKD